MELMEQENIDNGRPAKNRHASSCKGVPSSTAAGTLKSQRKEEHSDQVDGLAYSLSNVKLSGDLKEKDDLPNKTVANRDDRPISNYKPLPFPPKGYTADTIQLSSTSPSNQLLSSLDVIKKSGENKTVNRFYASTSLVATVAATSHSVKLDPKSPQLEEKMPKLIDTAKRCLKSTNSNDGNKKNSTDHTLNTSLLRVAIYSLRSVLPIMATSKSNRSNVSVVIKLLYHCSVLAGDACHARFKLWGSAKSKMKQEDIGLILEYALLCLGAYEGLGRSLHIGEMTRKPTNRSEAVHWDELMPTNVAPSKDISQQQASKIVLESSFCAASCLICLSLTSMYVKASKISDKLTVPNDFYFTSETILCEMPKAIPSFQLIVNNVIMPYVLRSLEGDSKTLNGDGLRHVKKAFRLLWECSRTIETICAMRDGSALRMACLDVQLNAIYFVMKIFVDLANVNPQLLRGSSPSDLKEIVDLFDRSASSAMKSCGLYEKAAGLFDESPSASSPKRKKDALCHFHCVVGSEMETAATLIFESGDLPPSAFFEYCVYRMIHQWRLKGDLASTRPFEISGDKTGGSSDSLIGQSILSVIRLSVYSLRGLRGSSQALDQAECDGIASRFHKYVINGASASSLARCRSMLLMLDLKSQAIELSQVKDDRSSRRKNHQFAVLGFVLGRILAPLEHKLAQLTDEPQKTSTLSLSSADSSAKAATLMEVAFENISEDFGELRKKYAKEADHFLRESFDLLLGELDKLKKQDINGRARPVLAIEMFAKAAAMTNKQRVGRKICATELLTQVAVKSFGKEFFRKYQLTNRYAMLASTFQSSGNHCEACAALATAAWCAIESIYPDDGQNDEGDPISEEILLYPQHSPDVIDRREDVASSGLSQVIFKLANAYLKYIKCEDVSRGVIEERTLMNKIIQAARPSSKSDPRRVRLSKLLHYTVFNQKRYEKELSTSQVAQIIRVVLKGCVKAIIKSSQCEAWSSEDSVHFLDEVKLFLNAQNKKLSDLEDSDVSQVLSSSLHVSFATVLADSRSFQFPRLSAWSTRKSHIKQRDLVPIQQACLQLQLAIKCFPSADDGDETHQDDVCFFAQLAAVQLHGALLWENLSLARISETDEPIARKTPSVSLKYDLALKSCGQALDIMRSSPDEEIYSIVLESLLATLKRLLQWFSNRGDRVSAAQSFAGLQTMRKLMCQPQSALDSVSDFFTVASKFEDLSSVFATNCTFPTDLDSLKRSQRDDTGAFDELLETLVKWTDVSLQIIDFNSSSVDCTDLILFVNRVFLFVARQDEGTHHSPDESTDDDSSSYLSYDTDLLQLQLVAITLLMLHAKLSLDNGRARSSIIYLLSCRSRCIDCAKYLRSCRVLYRSDNAMQLDDIQSSSYERLAIAYSLLGIRRKAEDHSLMAVMKQKVLPAEQCQSVTRVVMQELIRCIESQEGWHSLLHPLRTLMTTKSRSTSKDKLAMQEVQMKSTISSVAQDEDSNTMTNRVVSMANNAIAFDKALRHVPGFKAKLYIDRAYRSLRDNVTEGTDLFTKRAELELLVSQAKLTRQNDRTTAYRETIESDFSSGLSVSDAYYKLGLIALSRASANGELRQLWGKHASFIGDNEPDYNNEPANLEDVAEAEKLFGAALKSAPPFSHEMSKKILRCLALVSGPGSTKDDRLISSALIHASIGGTARNSVQDSLPNHLLQAFDDENLDADSRLKSICESIEESAARMPNCWNVVAMTICPTGDLLVSSIRSAGGNDVDVSTVCSFSTDRQNGPHSDLLGPLDKVIERSQRQLHGMTEEVQAEQFSEKESRQRWWDVRKSIDGDLNSLLQYAEENYFSSEAMRRQLIPDIFESGLRLDLSLSDESSECSGIEPGNLASRFEATECHSPAKCFETDDPHVFDEVEERAKLKKMTVAVLKDKLSTVGLPEQSWKKLRKAELIDLLVNEMSKDDFPVDDAGGDDVEGCGSHDLSYDPQAPHKSRARWPSSDDICRQPEAEPCTILVLDEHLLRFPFESMDMMDGRTITRVPSFPFISITLAEICSGALPEIDMRKVKFVLDPEANLTESAHTLSNSLDTLASRHDWEWEGIVGKMPAPTFMMDALTEECGLYLYCGHGGGEKGFSRSQIEELLTRREDGIRGCRASVILMGCSSGRLVSVNTSKVPTGNEHQHMHYDPEGIALSYLLAGAPCVVGNLWDVTDRDIDRYCLTLLEDFVGDGLNQANQPQSLAKCVATARRGCKLRYIVGSAPVCYGLPVYFSCR